MLDSVADLLFAAAYAVRILPVLSIPLWIWFWIAGIAVVKIAGILWKSGKEHKLSIAHSFANKLTGLFVFLLPLTVHIIDVKYSSVVICIMATLAAIGEISKSK